MELRIPEAGLELESSADSMAALPLQAFAITLNDSMIENLIECVQNGEDIQLSLGATPSFLYGSHVHRLSQPSDPSSYDLYLTEPSATSKPAQRLPNPTMSVFRKPENFAPLLKQPEFNPITRRNVPAKPRKESTNLNADILALQDSLAQVNAEKQENSTKVVDSPLPSAKRGCALAKSKLLSSARSGITSTGRSMPTSPAPSGMGSPSISASESTTKLVVERAKGLRVPLVHELAARAQTFEELFKAWPSDSEKEFQKVLEKVADFDSELQKYVLKKIYWKELDPFEFSYKTGEERQQAIDNAVRQFDRMRLAASEPEWQKLLPKNERNMGKCLSKLQSTLARGPAALQPKIKVQKADGSGSDSGSKENEQQSSGSENKKKKPALPKGGEAMARSISQPLPAKGKKGIERDGQAKRAVSNVKKTVTPKVSPTKGGPKAGVSKDGRILSSEFVTESDSDEEVPLSQQSAARAQAIPRKVADKPAERPPKPAATPASTPAPAPAPKAKPKPVPRERIEPQVIARPITTKRPRDDDDSSSSSGTPLSKRFKVKPPPQPLKHRPSDASQGSRSTSSGASLHKAKNTSPAKSSPLASSPPTNASDLDQADDRAGVGNAASRKRRLGDDFSWESDARSKRQRLSQDLITKALKFRVFYQKYEALHKEIAGLDNPPQDKMADLLDMHQRLQTMKSEIYREVPPDRRLEKR